jgi:hypothetical protein
VKPNWWFRSISDRESDIVELVAPWWPSTVPFACRRLGSIRLHVTISSCSGEAANIAAIDTINPKPNNRSSGAIELLPAL